MSRSERAAELSLALTEWKDAGAPVNGVVWAVISMVEDACREGFNCDHNILSGTCTVMIEAHALAGIRARCTECGQTEDVTANNARLSITNSEPK